MGSGAFLLLRTFWAVALAAMFTLAAACGDDPLTPPVVSALSMGALILEPFAPILLWVRVTRPWWALALIGMHVALELFANIGWWQFIMIAGLTAFLPTPWIERAAGWLRRVVPGPIFRLRYQ